MAKAARPVGAAREPWTSPLHEEVWEDRVFDVVDFGAVPNDRAGDTQALHAALAAAGQNGGGIVHLPRGRYQDPRHLGDSPVHFAAGRVPRAEPALLARTRRSHRRR